MAIALDAATGTPDSGVARSSITYSHTVTGTNPGLVVFPFVGDANGRGDAITGVTYNGTSMTQFKAWNFATGRYYYGYKLANPSTGTNNVVVSFSNTLYCSASSLSYTDVDQTNFEDSNQQASGTSTATLSFTTTADNCWLVSSGFNTNNGAATASTGTTSRVTTPTAQTNSGDSNGAKTPAGSHSMAWTSGSGPTYAIGIAIKPYSGGGSASTAKFLSSLGVG